MSPEVRYISGRESSNLPVISIDPYSFKLDRTRESYTQIRRVEVVGRGLWEESSDAYISGNQDIDIVPYSLSGYDMGLSTCAGQIRKFPSLEHYLFATSQNPSAEILNKINPRVMHLREVALEEEEQESLSIDSYLGLVSFLNRIYDLSLIPILGLTYEGNIRAHWRFSPDERLALDFLDSFNLKFVFFYPDSYDPTKILRISGSGSVLSFLEDYPRAWEFLRRLSD